MDYPRELKLSPENEEKLRIYLDTELQTHRAERAKWVDDLKRWQEDYFATPTATQATFPFRGAANIIVPLTAIAVESIHAREMTTLFGLEQFSHVVITDPTKQTAQRDLERAIDFELLKGCDIRKFCDHTLLENKKLGSCVGKVGYEKIIKTAVKTVDGHEKEFDVIQKQGPTLDPVPLANFLMPFTATNPQNSPWCGEEHLANFYTITNNVNSGLFRKDVLENLQGFFSTSQQLSSTKYTQSLRALQDQTPIQWPREIGWQEVWLAFDVDGSPSLGLNPNPKEIVVHYHWPSRTFFSIRYNWYDDLHRPYRTGVYFPLEHRWAGIGVGKQNEQFQEMVTTVHRQRLDNATLANMRMFKAKQGSGIGPNEPLFPGKIFLLDEVGDFEAIEGGSEVYPSGYNDESQLVVYSQQRTGVNELNLGMPQAGTPSTATSDVQRVQAESRKFEYLQSNSHVFLNQIIRDVLAVQSQFGFRDRRYIQMLGTNAQLIESLLTLPPQDIQSQLFFEVKVIGATANDAIDRNSWTQYAGMLQQYWTNILQMTMSMQNPQLLSMVTGYAMSAATEAMKQISEGFDVRGVERFVLPQQIIDMLTQAQQNGPPIVQPGQGSGLLSPSINQGTGLLSNPSSFGQFSGNSNQ